MPKEKRRNKQKQMANVCLCDANNKLDKQQGNSVSSEVIDQEANQCKKCGREVDSLVQYESCDSWYYCKCQNRCGIMFAPLKNYESTVFEPFNNQ